MIILIILISYILGSIPFGYILSKLVKKIDIRDYGSGNTGATNTLRILGPFMASIVLIGDMSKGYFSIYLSHLIRQDSIFILTIVGLAVICGHDWSLFLKFKGGKGVATTFGVILALNPMIAILAAIVWGIIIISTRYASLASISAVISIIFFMILFKQPYEYIIFSMIIMLLTIFTHKENIKRLKMGNESKIGEKIKIKKK